MIIKSARVRHRLRYVVFFLSLEEKSSLVNDAHLDEGCDILRRYGLLWKIFFILVVALTTLETRILASLWIFIANEDARSTFFVFRELSRGSLFLDDTPFETVFVRHTSLNKKMRPSFARNARRDYSMNPSSGS